MYLRFFIGLLCVVLFINGCSSLLSRVSGTHKLREFGMERVASQGVGDREFLQIKRAWLTEVHALQADKSRGYLQYPVLSAQQYRQHREGRVIEARVVGWMRLRDTSCLARNDCYAAGAQTLTGMVRPLKKQYRKTEGWEQQGIRLAPKPLFIEIGAKPLDWYWHLAIMAGALVLGLGTEFWRQRSIRRTAGLRD